MPSSSLLPSLSASIMAARCSMAPLSISGYSNLYCAEDARDVASWLEDSNDDWTRPSFPVAGDTLISLLAAEDDRMPFPDHISRSPEATARQDAINWILKMSDFYGFRPVTAYLAVNYLDRFLSVRAPPAAKEGQCAGGGWPMQLLSVACISVAAKMEETQVPTLLDLQILEPKFVFEPRTICRMELLLMAALRWRMRAVTPFDFLPYFAASVDCSAAVISDVFSRSSELIRATLRVIDFLIFRPSAIAAAAVLSAASEIINSSAIANLSCFHEMVSKDMVRECLQIMEEYLNDSCPSARRVKPAAEPKSPVGVLDVEACSSCDTRRADSPPPLKRRRLLPDPDCRFT